MSQQAVVSQRDHKSVLALLFSLSPLYFLVQARSRLSLDNLHIGLIQVVLLLVLRYILGYDPRPGYEVETKVVPSDDQQAVEGAGSRTALKQPQRRRKQPKKKKKQPGLFPAALLDSNVYSFLSITAPEYLKLVPNKPSQEELSKLPKSVALSDWNNLHEADNVKVLQHPTTKTLYAIQATFEDVSLRQLFETLVSIDKRPEWDKMCQGTEAIEDFEVGKRKGSVSWLGMKGMAVVKPKDMCLMSVGGRFPNENKEDTTKRLFVATRSFDHPKCPPKPGFNRMSLAISGFVAEEVGNGSKVIQITDLGGLGSWVPSAVFKTVTQTMIPKSLGRLGKVAAARDIAKESKFPVESEEWMAPLLGTATDEAEGEDEEEGDAEDDGEDVNAEGDDDDELSPSESRELHGLVSQLRSLTTRLTALEGKSGSRGPVARLCAMLGIEGDSFSATAVTAAASAMGAAAAVAALRTWNNRKK